MRRNKEVPFLWFYFEQTAKLVLVTTFAVVVIGFVFDMWKTVSRFIY